MPAIKDFDKQQPVVRDALIALVDKIGPSILMTHSQGGAFGWPVADARPDKVKAILAIEPNGPPGRSVEFIGAPDWFKEGKLELTYGITAVPLTYAPALADPAELKFVKEDKPDGPGLATCWKQAEPARQLANLKMPILVLTSEASYHAPYDHCTVKFLQQAGVKPDLHQARRSRHQGQQPRDDAGEEQQGDRRRDRGLAGQDVQGVARNLFFRMARVLRASS